MYRFPVRNMLIMTAKLFQQSFMTILRCLKAIILMDHEEKKVERKRAFDLEIYHPPPRMVSYAFDKRTIHPPSSNAKQQTILFIYS